jgi:fructose-1,6-bisphosphatase I / sedoheptulose-1,7-bisphosphatase
LHQRVSFIFGARDEVERIERLHGEVNEVLESWPLYGSRGLFRAQAN